MATKKQISSANKHSRKKPGTGGSGKFYHIRIRPKSEFTSFRMQDVGRKGGLERLAGRRSSGSWATVSWLISKKNAHVDAKGRLVIDEKKERAALSKALRGRITHVRGDIFAAHPVKNIPERAKPTRAMKKARSTNIRKAQKARRSRRYARRG